MDEGRSSMLEIKGLTAYYGESEILHDINLSVPDGKIIALVGRNGVGKTTTLKSIMGGCQDASWQH